MTISDAGAGSDAGPGIHGTITIASTFAEELKRIFSLSGLGADPRKLPGRHNKAQWEKLQTPNLVYTDGREWALYRNGEPVGSVVRFTPISKGRAVRRDRFCPLRHVG